MGDHGTVSWCYGVFPWKSPPILPSHADEEFVPLRRFERRVHIIRHPLLVVASLEKIIRRDQQHWYAEHGYMNMDEKPKLLRCMHAWLHIVGKCEPQATATLRLCHWRQDWGEAFGVDPPDSIRHSNKSSGIFRANVYTWRNLEHYDRTAVKAMRALVRKYKLKLET